MNSQGKDAGVTSVLSVLDYTKSNKQWFDRQQLFAGYHSVSIRGQKIKGQRDPEARLAKLPYSFAGKRVLDIGCSNGGLLHALANQIAFGVGVDFNSKCINAANTLKAVNGAGNIHFYTFDLDKEDLSMLGHFVLGAPVDVCLFLNLSLWVKRWREAFKACAELAESMVFEAHGSEEQQAEQLAFVRSVFSEVQLISEQSDDDPTYAKRKMVLCHDRVLQDASQSTEVRAQSLQLFDEASVRQAYEAAFGEPATSIRFFPGTQESVVAEIDGKHIVKLPRPKRGLQGIEVEKAVTDFLKDRLDVRIPEITVHTSAASLARYTKLPGECFDKARYAKLAEQAREQLALQLARFMAALHAITPEQLTAAAIPSAPSWQLSMDLIEAQLGKEQEPAIKALLPQVIRNHRALQVPEANVVFGHFDLHGGNILLDQRMRLSGVLDFGNCKRGDLHQDLSAMNLSSPDLADRMGRHYARLTGRRPNRLLVQHYTTIFYLNLLAGLKRQRADKKYSYWLNELNGWYDHLLADRAQARLKRRAPVSKLAPGWRKWLASNLMKGSPPSTLQSVLRERGFTHADVAAELALAGDHPYVEAGKEIFHTLAKRNWLLRTCDQLAALDSRYCTEIQALQAPAFDVFVREYYSKQLPVLLRGGVDHWPALQRWTPDYLQEHFGAAQIEVQFGREADDQYERNAGKHKKRMTMREFVALVRGGGDSNDYYMTANNTRTSLPGLEPLFQDVSDFASGYRDAASVHSANFLWFGPRGTFTPLHHDLTNNMLIQIFGRKRVTLIPAAQTQWLYNDSGVFSAAAYPDFDPERHPLMKHATPMRVMLHPGEALFIPIGWWHCVESLDVSISLSFTNFNAPNQFSVDFPR